MINIYEIFISEHDAVNISCKKEKDGTFLTEPAWRGSPITAEKIIIKLNSKKPGRFYDWLPGWSWAPYVQKHAKDRLVNCLGNSVQWVGPFNVQGHELFLFNCINIIDCAKQLSNDNRLYVDYDKLINQCCFRIKRFERRVFVNESVKDRIESSKDTGIRFGMLQEDGRVNHPFASLKATPPIWMGTK